MAAMESAFAAARAADPQAQLFYNDYGLEATDHHKDAVCELLLDLRQRKAPIDGVGLQMHLTLMNHFQILLDVCAEIEGWDRERAWQLARPQRLLAARAVRNLFPSFSELSTATLRWTSKE